MEYCRIKYLNKNLAKLAMCIIIFILLGKWFKAHLLQSQSIINNEDNCDGGKKELYKMSKLLTDAMKKIGQMSCNFSSRHQISDNGGWCSEISGPDSTAHYFDSSLAKELNRFLANKRVASFGDGPGKYKAYMDEQGSVNAYDAFDGAPFAETTTNGLVSFLDLSVPIYHLIEYDWVISLEVAEHIPPKYETVYLENLVRHAKEGIILSWSHQGQRGHGHVNNRDIEYVKMRLGAYGFFIDELMSNSLKINAEAPWFKDNINVFFRKPKDNKS